MGQIIQRNSIQSHLENLRPPTGCSLICAHLLSSTFKPDRIIRTSEASRCHSTWIFLMQHKQSFWSAAPSVWRIPHATVKWCLELCLNEHFITFIFSVFRCALRSAEVQALKTLWAQTGWKLSNELLLFLKGGDRLYRRSLNWAGLLVGWSGDKRWILIGRRQHFHLRIRKPAHLRVIWPWCDTSTQNIFYIFYHNSCSWIFTHLFVSLL